MLVTTIRITNKEVRQRVQYGGGDQLLDSNPKLAGQRGRGLVTRMRFVPFALASSSVEQGYNL